MKVLFTGLPYFASKFVKELNDFDPNNKYVFCDTYTSKKERLKFLLHALNSNLIVSFNGVTSKSGSLDLALFFKKKIMLQWHGSDVLSVTKNKELGIYTDKYINNSVGYTDASWLQDELNELKIDTQLLPFKSLVVEESIKPFKSHNVLTYIAKGREVFYGLNEIINLANNFPEIKFSVIGTDGKGFVVPQNVIFLGWVTQEESNKLRNDNAIFIRLTEHDGYSLSVLESLANGNYVLWNNPHPKCYYASGNNVITSKFQEMLTEIKGNKLNRSKENINWCKENLNKEIILSNYIKTLEAIAKR